VISKFFQSSNIIDTHNQLRQDLLRLETKWKTRSAYFRLATTLIGINVTDCFLLAGHHKVINYSSNYGTDGKKISIQRFAGMLSHQLIHAARALSAVATIQFLPEDEAAPLSCAITLPSNTVSDLSSPDLHSSSDKQVIRAIPDATGKTHYLVKFDVTKDPSGRSRTKKRKCKKCLGEGQRRDVSYYCITCGESYSFCNNNNGRDCFKHHIETIRRLTRQSL
jgi:hypothetical protein